MPGQPFVDLLEGEDVPGAGDEPHHVPGDAPLRHLHEEGRVPVRERAVPGQGQQARRIGGGGPEEEPHVALPPVDGVVTTTMPAR